MQSNIEFIGHCFRYLYHQILWGSIQPSIENWNGKYQLMIYNMPPDFETVYEAQPGYESAFPMGNKAATQWQNQEMAEKAKEMFFRQFGIRAYLSRTNSVL